MNMTEDRHIPESDLNAYLDSELPATARPDLERHLAGCDRCRARLKRLETLFVTVETLPDVALQRDLTSGVMEALPDAPHPTARVLLVLEALLAIVGLTLLRPSLSRQLTRLPQTDLRSTLIPWLNRAILQMTGVWESGAEAIGSLAQVALDSLRAIDPLNVPFTTLGPWLALATLVWLAGNRYLLRTSR